MSQPDYSQFITERIHEGLNFNRNHRFFLLYGGLTADEFLTRSMYRATLRETLWATLKQSGIRRVIFYNAAEKFLFLDEESARLSQQLGSALPQTPPVGNGRSRMQRGPLGSRNVLKNPTRMRPSGNDSTNPRSPAAPSESRREPSPAKTIAAPLPDESIMFPQETRMTRGRAMSDSAVLTTLNDFINDSSIRTAVVIEELENLSSNFETRIGDQLASRLREWSGLKAENRNVVVFITSREPRDKESVDQMRQSAQNFPEIANLINIALGESKADADGYICYLPPPFELEITRLLDELRIQQGLQVDWNMHERLVRALSAENKPFRDLDGRFVEYASDLRKHRPKDEKLSLETARLRKWITADADPRPALQRLDEMIGMTEVKAEVRRLTNWLKSQKSKREENPELPAESLNLHLALTGNPGTGKTTVAELIGEIYRDIGLLKRGHTEKCRNASDLIGQAVGESEQKTNTKINRALDGVLFIDEAPSLLAEGTKAYGEAAIKTLVARIESERHRLAVIVAGYPNQMRDFLISDAGLSERFATQIEIKDYSPSELFEIFEQIIRRKRLTISDEMRDTMKQLLARMYELRGDRNYFPVDEDGNSSYRNAGTVRNLVEVMEKESSDRLEGRAVTELTLADLPDRFRVFLPQIPVQGETDGNLQRLINEIDDLVGLQPIKQFVRRLVKERQLAAIRKRDLTASGKNRHMMFTGNPGTGKTTVARLIGQLYKELGILRRGHFTEVKRKDFIGQYQGVTDFRTSKILEDAMDGVLFIDEVYSLARDLQDSYGVQAIDQLMAPLEDFRDRLVVIFAGYTREVKALLEINSGFASRIGYTIEFPDFTAPELLEIFLQMAAQGGYEVPDDVRAELLRQFEWTYSSRDSTFGNARDVRVKFYQWMVDHAEERLLDALDPAEESTLVNSFVITDIPQLGPQVSRAPQAVRRFSLADIVLAQYQAPVFSGNDSIPELVQRAVGFIKTDQGSGTGFLISPDGHVLTAHHVVENVHSIRFRPHGSDQMIEGELLEKNVEADIAILKFEGNGFPFARMAQKGSTLKIGTPLGVLGYPMGEALGTEVTYTSGWLSARKMNEGVSVFQLDASAYKGNSGGPVFVSDTGEVIGILSYGPNDTMNFAISIDEFYQRFR